MSQKEHDTPFKDLKPSSKITVIVSIGLLITIAAAVIFGGYFFGIKGLFTILGITYDSNQALLFFILGCFAAGLVIDPLTKVVSLIMIHSLSMRKTALFAFVLYFIANFITICLVDYFMDSIYIPDALLFVISAFIALIELAFDHQPKS
ncbi:hypothetical protein FO507_10310 [Bacillus mojavensis]|uniref:YrvL family regulatory protein n=1 Tax=Bacillus TaxID=1386 RepID=UPI0002893C13|nr:MULTISPECIES: YrvL family regulatory protein [Bacillus]MCC2931665.1 regulatory YrvL family protein [Bacillus sp. LBG-1-113]MDR4227763.1 hypothetical protein [Bacillus mojavensis]MEC1678870.1 YrvL family regulatory protein [Bacillus mojavensis]MEC1713069.1 YrvL family regulatory protein [Bacillus mojavensis]MEC3588422.1 YrvL family regulatory protein [Bacillus mojavensis]